MRILLFFFSFTIIFGQSATIFQQWLSIAREYRRKFYLDSARMYLNKAYLWLQKHPKPHYQMQWHYAIGVWYLQARQWDSAAYHIQKALQIAKELKDKKEELQAYKAWEQWHLQQGKVKEALAVIDTILKLSLQLKDTSEYVKRAMLKIDLWIKFFNQWDSAAALLTLLQKNISLNRLHPWVQLYYHSNVAVFYWRIGRPDLTLKHYFRMLHIVDSLQLIQGEETLLLEESVALQNIAQIYAERGDTAKAVAYYTKALQAAKKRRQPIQLGRIYLMLGDIYFNQQKRDSALASYYKALSYYRMGGDTTQMAYAYLKIANTFLEKQKNKTKVYLDSVFYLLKNCSQFFSLQDTAEIALPLADLYKSLGNYTKAFYWARKGYTAAKAIKTLNFQRSLAYLIYELYKERRNYRKALQWYERYVTLKDSLLNEEKIEAIAQITAQQAYEQQLLLKERELQYQQQLAQERHKEQQMKLWVTLFITFLIIMFSGVLYNRLRITQQQKQIIESQKQQVEAQKVLIEQKNKAITESIEYASRIQQALLSYEVPSLFPYFIFYLPRDIVSGDFYWLYWQDPWWYFAVGDCTGHGVPGAFMTMLGITTLNELMAHHHHPTPNQLLEWLREEIISQLHHGNQFVQDGMDIVLLRIHKEKRLVEYAGANNRLWLVTPKHFVYNRQLPLYKSPLELNQHILYDLKTDKQPVGYYPKMQPFTLYRFQWQSEMKLYLYSDGFADQFGGERGKKFTLKRLKQLVLNASHLPFNEQKNFFKMAFLQWKGEYQQIDDVTIAAIAFLEPSS